MKACSCCKRAEEALDAHGLCDDCHGQAGAGPDLTCAMLGRGEGISPAIVGVDPAGRQMGCCAICHGKHWAGEVQIKDGRWAEACCAVIDAIEKRGLLRFTPFKKGAHRPVLMPE